MSTINVSHRRPVTAALTPVKGDLTFEGDSFKKMPGPYGDVGGSFFVKKCANLISLEGGPGEVSKDVWVSANSRLRDLLDGPYKVGGSYRCSNNPSMVSLVGSPQDVPGAFNCANNPKLTSFNGGPKKVGKTFKSDSCNSIKSTRGMPIEINGNVTMQMMTGLEDISDMWRHVKKINGELDLTGTPIERGGLGLLMIAGLTNIKSEQKAFAIISAHLSTGPQGVILCRKQLIEAGLEAFTSM